MADEERGKALEMFNKLKLPASMLATSICFITVYSAWDLIRFTWFGHSLSESTLMITATMGVLAIISSILLGNGINKIRKSIS